MLLSAAWNLYLWFQVAINSLKKFNKNTVAHKKNVNRNDNKNGKAI